MQAGVTCQQVKYFGNSNQSAHLICQNPKQTASFISEADICTRLKGRSPLKSVKQALKVVFTIFWNSIDEIILIDNNPNNKK